MCSSSKPSNWTISHLYWGKLISILILLSGNYLTLWRIEEILYIFLLYLSAQQSLVVISKYLTIQNTQHLLSPVSQEIIHSFRIKHIIKHIIKAPKILYIIKQIKGIYCLRNVIHSVPPRTICELLKICMSSKLIWNLISSILSLLLSLVRWTFTADIKQKLKCLAVWTWLSILVPFSRNNPPTHPLPHKLPWILLS